MSTKARSIYYQDMPCVYRRMESQTGKEDTANRGYAPAVNLAR